MTQKSEDGLPAAPYRKLVYLAVAVRPLLAHVHLKLFLGARQFPGLVGIAGRSHRVEAPHARNLEEDVTEQHASQVRNIAYRAGGVKRIQESNGTDDHDEILHLDGNQ